MRSHPKVDCPARFPARVRASTSDAMTKLSMPRHWPGWRLVPAVAIVAGLAATATTPAAHAQATREVNESFFLEQLHPVLKALQCNECHNDNGVGSETRLE